MRWFIAVPLITIWITGTAEATGSPGCGRPPPVGVPDHVMLEGRERSLIADLPAGYDPGHPHRLVVAFHRAYQRQCPGPGLLRVGAAGGRPDHFRLSAGACGRPMAPSAGPIRETSPTACRDYALLDTIVATLRRVYCIDPERIFVVGHSLGASFVNSLACARGDLIRGVGSVAGGVQRSHCRGSVAALVLHNPADKLVPFSEGERARNSLVAQNGQDEATGEPAEVGPFECERFAAHDPANPVLWCPHHQDQSIEGDATIRTSGRPAPAKRSWISSKPLSEFGSSKQQHHHLGRYNSEAHHQRVDRGIGQGREPRSPSSALAKARAGGSVMPPASSPHRLR